MNLSFRIAACVIAAVGMFVVALAIRAEPPESLAKLVRARRIVANDEVFVLSEIQAGRSWGPEQAEGPPNVLRAGSNALAWTSLGADDQPEWLQCDYDAAIDVRAVIVHANAFPGAVVKVSAFNADDDEVIAWEGEDPTPRDKPRGVSVIPVKLGFPVRRIKVFLDSVVVTGWNEIDAIGLEDGSGMTHWAKHVEASSSYATPRGSRNSFSTKSAYSPAQVTGEPDTAAPGDHSTAWCPATPDGQPEWLLCDFKTQQRPIEIVVHENMSPGAVSKIGVFNDDGEEVTVWEGVDPTPRNQPWGVSVFPIKAPFPFRKLKLYINSPEVPGWNEIDAVGLRTSEGDSHWATSAEGSSTYGSARSMPAIDARLMQPNMTNSDQKLRDLQKEVQQLRKELQELKGSLKDKR